MNYFRRLNPNMRFGTVPNNKDTIINVICGILIVILIVVIVGCLCFNKNEDQFADENEEIIIVSAANCGFAQRAEAMLDKEKWIIEGKKVRKVDIQSPEGKKTGATGTPTYFLNGKKSVGAKPLQAVAEELGLTGKESFGNVGSSLTVIGSSHCPFCMKQYAVLDQNDIKYNKIDSNSLEGKEHMTSAKANGVPLLKYEGKYIVGFNDKESLDKLGIK